MHNPLRSKVAHPGGNHVQIPGLGCAYPGRQLEQDPSVADPVEHPIVNIIQLFDASRAKPGIHSKHTLVVSFIIEHPFGSYLHEPSVAFCHPSQQRVHSPSVFATRQFAGKAKQSLILSR